jgi:CheY-like chemotaxis protein
MALLLLVEDAQDIVLIVQRLSRRAGQEVVAYGNVAEAWTGLQHRWPDLILLDLNLPGERGEILCRRVRASASFAPLPVALFAHLDRPTDIVSGLEAGADYLVSKDLLCSPEAWSARLKELMPPDRGHPGFASLQWGESPTLLPTQSPGFFDALNRVLRHPLVRQLGSELAQFVVRRALLQAQAAGRPTANQGEGVRRECLAIELEPDGLGLRAEEGLQDDWAPFLPGFVRALAEQIWCLVGTEAGVALLEELATAVRGPDR